MKTFTVIAHFNIVKTSSLHEFMGNKTIAVDGFVLKAAEPTFCRGVIPAITFATHRTHHAVVLELGLIAGAAILAAPIGVHN